MNREPGNLTERQALTSMSEAKKVIVDRMLEAKKVIDATAMRAEERQNAGKKRLNQLTWPENWTRMQKQRCVAACKRAVKKGYTVDSVQWKHELAKAGFR